MHTIKIARRTTGAKGCYFLTGFLQDDLLAMQVYASVDLQIYA